jgi:hypothetical protein
VANGAGSASPAEHEAGGKEREEHEHLGENRQAAGDRAANNRPPGLVGGLAMRLTASSIVSAAAVLPAKPRQPGSMWSASGWGGGVAGCPQLELPPQRP